MDGAPDSRPSIRKVDPAELAPPVGFAHAMVASGGRTVYLAGQTALDSTGVVVGKGIVEQVDRVLSNLCVALREAGGTPEHLVKLTIFVSDVADYLAHRPEIGKVWRERLGKVFPAMTLVEVSDFWNDGALVEIEGVAVVPA